MTLAALLLTLCVGGTLVALRAFLIEHQAGNYCSCGCHRAQHEDGYGACSGHWCSGCNRFG